MEPRQRAGELFSQTWPEQAAPVYRVAELAKLLDMGQRQTREAITRGEIPRHKIGSQVRCSKVAINRWLNGDEPSGRQDRPNGH